MHFDRSKQIYLQLHSSIAVRLHRPKRTQRVSIVAAVMFGSFLQRYSLEAFHQSLWHVPQGSSTVIISSSRKSEHYQTDHYSHHYGSLFTPSQIIVHIISDHYQCRHLPGNRVVSWCSGHRTSDKGAMLAWPFRQGHLQGERLTSRDVTCLKVVKDVHLCVR